MSLRTTDAPMAGDIAAADSASVIDRHSSFDGTYSTDRDLRIEGNARGTLRCQGTLHVAQGATVNAEVEAEQVVVAGLLEGSVTCRTRLQIMPSGELKGRITTPSLVINEGARYQGQMEMPSRNSRLAAGRQSGGATASIGSVAAESGDAVESTAPPSSFIRRFGGQDAASRDNAPEGSTAEG